MDHFTERQRLVTPWLLAILLGTVGLFTWGLWVKVVRGRPWGSHPASDAILILMWLLAASILVFFLLLELRTRIGVNGRAYNARGSEGIQLVDWLENRILIGTQDPEGFMAAVESARASRDGQ